MKRNMEHTEIKEIITKLEFNVNSKGFDYWIQAIQLYTTFNEKITMTELYKELAFEFLTTEKSIEKCMRISYKKSSKNIQIYFNYNSKISNKTILELFRKKCLYG